MLTSVRESLTRAIAVSVFAALGVFASHAQQQDPASVIAKVDSAVKARVDSIASYIVTEHYSVYRGKDETHSVADMTVRTEYRKETGKTYTILSQSGSGFIVTHVLGAILEREKQINLPGTREHSWLVSANYQMNLKPGGPQWQDGRQCVALDISPRQKSPNLLDGTIWVDANDGSIVRLEGVTMESPSIFTGASHLMRQYTNVNGFAMAMHARAVTDSFLLGRTIITIDYRDYQIQTLPAK
jgi:outer membrane lipoprotein-sorting protein